LPINTLNSHIFKYYYLKTNKIKKYTIKIIKNKNHSPTYFKEKSYKKKKNNYGTLP